MRHFWKGLALVWGKKELRKQIWMPLLKAAAIGTVGVALSYWLLTPLLSGLLAKIGLAGWWGTGGAWLLMTLLWVFAFSPTFYTIAILASAFEWEKLSKRVEELVHGPNVPSQAGNLQLAMMENARRWPRSFATIILCAVTAPILGGVVSALIAGYQGVFDYTSPAFARRGVYWPAQKRVVKKLPERVPLILVGGFLSLIPFVNLLMIPVLVATGTLMTAEEYPHGVPEIEPREAGVRMF